MPARPGARQATAASVYRSRTAPAATPSASPPSPAMRAASISRPERPKMSLGHRAELDLGVLQQLLHALLLAGTCGHQVGAVAGQVPQARRCRGVHVRSHTSSSISHSPQDDPGTGQGPEPFCGSGPPTWHFTVTPTETNPNSTQPYIDRNLQNIYVLRSAMELPTRKQTALAAAAARENQDQQVR